MLNPEQRGPTPPFHVTMHLLTWISPSCHPAPVQAPATSGLTTPPGPLHIPQGGCLGLFGVINRQHLHAGVPTKKPSVRNQRPPGGFSVPGCAGLRRRVPPSWHPPACACACAGWVLLPGVGGWEHGSSPRCPVSAPTSGQHPRQFPITTLRGNWRPQRGWKSMAGGVDKRMPPGVELW